MSDNENTNSITVIPVDEQVTNKNIEPQHIENLVYVIRNKQVMVDSDLALLYQVETKALNRAVKRNIKINIFYFSTHIVKNGIYFFIVNWE